MARAVPTTKLQSWGKLSKPLQHLQNVTHSGDMSAALAHVRESGMSALAIGLGRSYGDSGQNQGQGVISTAGMDRVLAFDPVLGVVRGEAGLSLSDVIARIVPFGWFLPTTPGSRFVTLGGAVANDVHGKNHHNAGTFGSSVTALGLWRSDQGYVEVTPDKTPDLFAATIGGLGLTGVILWVEFKLAKIGSAYLDEETCVFDNLDGYFDLARDSEGRFENTVSWIDCTAKGPALGRGIFSRSNWRDDGQFDVHKDKPALTMPMDAPNFALNPLTLKLFNTAYFKRGQANAGVKPTHYGSAFYPLDAIGNWNRLYGSQGFYQYQCVVPTEVARDATHEMLALIAASGQGSFLAVLKTFGSKKSPGLLSFPMPGVTLALDFPNRGDATLALFDRLDGIVAQGNGRLYPAKDARMTPNLFRQGYEHGLNQFVEHCDPALSSSFWRRVNYD